jgi:plastocyanin
MHIGRRITIIATVASVAACGGGDGYGTTAGPVTGGGTGAPGTVTVGSGIQYVSGHNGSMNPAVDTITAGTTVTWTWTGSLPHGVRSVGTPSFTSSETHTGSGTYVATFNTPGTYKYDCSVHGGAMTGTIVVLPGSSQSRSASYDATATLVDPVGDTFGANAKWDLTGLTLARDTGGITAMLDFSRDVVSPVTGDPAALVALVDLDLDQNPATGGPAVVDEFRQDGKSTGLGVDARISFATADDAGNIAVLDGDGRETGRVTPTYDGHRVRVRVPRSMLANDDGYVSAAAIVGIVGAPSDFVPADGHVTLLASSHDPIPEIAR